MDFLDRWLTRENRAVLLLLLLGAVLLFVRLGSASLWEVDEARFAEVAREMLERGEWLSLHFNYEPYFNKPPLLMWLTAMTYLLFGVSEASARVWSALFGLGTMLATLAIGRLLFNRRVAFTAALILITTLQWTAESRMGLMNTGVTFFITAALLFLLLAVKKEEPRWYLAFFVAMGLGVLTKGPIAIVFPGLIGLFYLGLARRWRDLISPYVWTGFVLMLAVAVPWHLVQWQRYGGNFLGTYFGYHMAARFASGIENNVQPQYYYPLVLLLGLLPWSAFLPGALATCGRAWREHREGLLFVGAWFAIIYVFFTVAKTKLPGYVTPVYPSLALFTALFAARLEEQGRWLRVSFLSLFILGALLLTSVPVLLRQVPAEYHVFILFFFIMGLVCALGGLVGWLLLRLKGRTDLAVSAGALVAVIMIGLLHLVAVPAWDAHKPTRPLVTSVKPRLPATSALGSYGLGEESSPFYLGRRVEFFKSLGELAVWLERGTSRCAMLPEAELPKLKEMVPGRVITVMHRSREYILVASAPPALAFRRDGRPLGQDEKVRIRERQSGR